MYAKNTHESSTTSQARTANSMTHTCEPFARRFLLASLAAGFATIGVLPVSGQFINDHLKLITSNGTANLGLGWSIAIDNGIIAVGAPGDGSAYLFDASTGVQIANLLANDGSVGAYFGMCIDIDNGVVAVGATQDEVNGPHSGSAYLFDASTGAWLFKLLPSDAAEWDQFGISVAIDNSVVAVGSRWALNNGIKTGSVYLFDASTGAQLFKLAASDAAAQGQFGYSVDIDNGVIAVGAYFDGDNGTGSGAAYLFDASTGAQLIKLSPSDGAGAVDFGSTIAIDNGVVVVVGAYRGGDNGTYSGSAYLFDASTGEQLFKLAPSDGVAYDEFGKSVAIDNGVVAVGAWKKYNDGSESGSAYLYDVSTGAQLFTLLPRRSAPAGDYFGVSVAIDNGVVAVGAPRDDDNGPNSGSAYLFSVPSTECVADVNGDGLLTPADFSAWIAAFNSNAPECDQNGDGVCTPADFTAWIANYNAGCP